MRFQAMTRMILAGVLDKFPSLSIVLARSGGALPALSRRLASCIDHSPVVVSQLKHDAWYYPGQLYFDTVATVQRSSGSSVNVTIAL